MTRWGIWRTHRTRWDVTEGWWKQDGRRVEYDSFDEAQAVCARLTLPPGADRRHRVTFSVQPLDGAVPLFERPRNVAGDGLDIDADAGSWVEDEQRLAREEAWDAEWDRRRRSDRWTAGHD
jgi:hypothetical protein